LSGPESILSVPQTSGNPLRKGELYWHLSQLMHTGKEFNIIRIRGQKLSGSNMGATSSPVDSVSRIPGN
jgi:hypothetical protein